MKKIKAPQPVGIKGLSNICAVVVCDVNDSDETVSYYISSVEDNDMVKVHKAKIYYRVIDNEAYFNSVVGRMLLSDFIKY